MVPETHPDRVENESEAEVKAEAQAERPPLKARIWNEIKTHPFGYSVLAVFLIAGPIAAPFLFPQAPPGAAIVGGLAFGLYAALSAVPQKFM